MRPTWQDWPDTMIALGCVTGGVAAAVTGDWAELVWVGVGLLMTGTAYMRGKFADLWRQRYQDQVADDAWKERAAVQLLRERRISRLN